MLDQMINISKEAGKLVKRLRQENNFEIKQKQDKSFVTSADLLSEELIVSRIKEYFGHDEIILSEEMASAGLIPNVNNKNFWLVDPIDSTQSYIDNKPDYCINITYMVNHTPHIGIIYGPATDTIWYATKNLGSYKQVANQPAEKITTRKVTKNKAVSVVSFPNHQVTPGLYAEYGVTQELVVASAIKFCYIAEGKADLYFRKRNKAADWDVASGQIIVEEAGGMVQIDPSENFTYGVPPFLAPTMIVSGHKL